MSILTNEVIRLTYASRFNQNTRWPMLCNVSLSTLCLINVGLNMLVRRNNTPCRNLLVEIYAFELTGEETQ